MERDAARREGDFSTADRIRETLSAAGVEVQDTPDGAKWSLGPDFDPATLETLA
jgi:cysteinyl-tRNA synthetase